MLVLSALVVVRDFECTFRSRYSVVESGLTRQTAELYCFKCICTGLRLRWASVHLSRYHLGRFCHNILRHAERTIQLTCAGSTAGAKHWYFFFSPTYNRVKLFGPSSMSRIRFGSGQISRFGLKKSVRTQLWFLLEVKNLGPSLHTSRDRSDYFQAGRVLHPNMVCSWEKK